MKTYRIEIPSGETAVTAATWDTSCGVVPQDFVHTDDAGFQEIVTDGHWAFDNNIIRFTASTNPTSSAREGYMTITYKVNGVSCEKRTHLVQAAGQGFNGKYRLILNDSSVVTAACDSSSAVTQSEISGYSGSVASAVIGDCVTSIGSSAFFYCTSFTSVTIPDSVTSIGDYAFCACSGLTSVDLGSGVTSIGNWAFANCTSLSSITIPNSVTSINYQTFYGCGLTSITIPNNVTSMGLQAFASCTGLTSATIGTGITSIGARTFSGCTSLASVTIPDSVTEIGGEAFYQCTSLTSVTMPSSVTTISGYAFYDCRSLTGITLLATTPPTLGESAFGNTNNCPIYVPSESVETYKSVTGIGWSYYTSRIQAIP